MKLEGVRRLNTKGMMKLYSKSPRQRTIASRPNLEESRTSSSKKLSSRNTLGEESGSSGHLQ